jgi:multiple sugar transport system substrate-binding protein
MAAVVGAGVAISLAGCGGSSSPNASGGSTTAAGGVTNLVMTIWGSDNDTKTYQARADAYTASNPKIKVTVRNIPVANYDQQVDTMITGGSSPDIILVDSSRAPGLASRGGIVDLSPLLAADKLDPTATVDPGRVDGYKFGGKQYALPDRGGNIVFYYNKTMFAAAGVSEPTVGWTWSQFVDAAKKLTIRDANNKVTQYGVAIDDWPNAVESVTTSFGASMFNSALTAAAVQSPEYQNALTQYVGLATDLKVSPTLADYANFGQNVNRDALFAQGKTAMIWAGVWDIPDFVKQGLDFGITAPPIAKTGAPTMEAFGTGLAIGAKSKNQDDAMQVLKYLFSADGQRPIVTNNEDVPSANALIPQWVASLPGGVKYDNVSADPSAVFSPPAPPQINQILKQWQQDLDPFFKGSGSVADATTVAAQHIDSTLSQG